MKIFVKAKPSAKEARVEKLDNNNFIIAVKEPPVKGMANAGIIKVLAEYFNVLASQIKIVSGHTLKNKIVEIKND